MKFNIKECIQSRQIYILMDNDNKKIIIKKQIYWNKNILDQMK